MRKAPAHPAEWEVIDPFFVEESRTYDEDTLIEEIVYLVPIATPIDTLNMHNSTYTLRLDTDAYECPDY